MTYGLGTENQNLPGFVTICPTRGHGGVQNYGNAFLPAAYQGTAIGIAGTPASSAQITQHPQHRTSSPNSSASNSTSCSR